MLRLPLFLRWLKVRMHRANMLAFAGLLMVLTIIVIMIVSSILDLLPDVRFAPNPEDAGIPIWRLAIMTIVVAPLLETLIFQAIPHFLWLKLGLMRPRSRWILIPMMGLAFGAMHYYSVHYIVVAALLGMLMMWGYVARYRRHAYWSLVIFHAFWNALALLMLQLGVGG